MPEVGGELSTEEQAVVAKLRAIDAQVRAHEAAHVAAGGGVVRGGPTYSYQRGPDGKQYAVSGEVAIDTGGVSGNPRATLAKAQKIQEAALAPANPSSQDRAVAAAAAALAAQAALELAQEKAEKARSEGGTAEDAKGQFVDISV